MASVVLRTVFNSCRPEDIYTQLTRSTYDKPVVAFLGHFVLLGTIGSLKGTQDLSGICRRAGTRRRFGRKKKYLEIEEGTVVVVAKKKKTHAVF